MSETRVWRYAPYSGFLCPGKGQYEVPGGIYSHAGGHGWTQSGPSALGQTISTSPSGSALLGLAGPPMAGVAISCQDFSTGDGSQMAPTGVVSLSQEATTMDAEQLVL